MAIHAREIGRSDIRFYAFEPSSLKCKWIEEVAEVNGVNVVVVNAAVGDCEKIVVPERGRKEKAIFDGSLKYEEVDSGGVGGRAGGAGAHLRAG